MFYKMVSCLRDKAVYSIYLSVRTSEARQRSIQKRDMDGKYKRYSKLDFFPTLTEESLSTPAQIMAHAKKGGQSPFAKFVTDNIGKLDNLIEQCQLWNSAETDAQREGETAWDAVKKRAGEPCSCNPAGFRCIWEQLQENFRLRHGLQHYSGSGLITRNADHFAAAIAKICIDGPSKNTRVPTIIGNANTGSFL